MTTLSTNQRALEKEVSPINFCTYGIDNERLFRFPVLGLSQCDRKREIFTIETPQSSGIVQFGWLDMYPLGQMYLKLQNKNALTNLRIQFAGSNM